MAPEIAYQRENFLGDNIQIKFGLGGSFATAKLPECFYEVGPQFGTVTCPAFSAVPGYLGTKRQLMAFTSFSSHLLAFSGLWQFSQSDSRGVA